MENMLQDELLLKVCITYFLPLDSSYLHNFSNRQMSTMQSQESRRAGNHWAVVEHLQLDNTS